MSHDLILMNESGRVCTLSLNRPEKKNSLSLELVEALVKALNELARRADVPVLVIRGAGDEAFCAGFDIASLPAAGQTTEAVETIRPVETLFQCVVDYPMPVIAMINGAAFGAGCELAVCCDIRVAADDARLGMPPARLGCGLPLDGAAAFHSNHRSAQRKGNPPHRPHLPRAAPERTRAGGACGPAFRAGTLCHPAGRGDCRKRAAGPQRDQADPEPAASVPGAESSRSRGGAALWWLRRSRARTSARAGAPSWKSAGQRSRGSRGRKGNSELGMRHAERKTQRTRCVIAQVAAAAPEVSWSRPTSG